MKKMYLMKGMAVLAMGLVVAGCNKLDFANQAQISDEEALENAEMQLGATIDPNQDWKMTKDVQGTVSVNLGTGKEYTLLMFDKNPFVNDDAVYYLKQTITDGSNGTYKVAVPSAQKQLYVTVIDDKNYSYSKYVFFNDDNAFTADLSTGTANARSMRRANPGNDVYPATHTYEVNGTVVAGANMNHNEWADPAKEYGGWLVPDALTEGQKLRVQKYFQANPNLSYEDPHYRHFFVQQVYTGGTDAPTTGNKEATVDASGKSHVGMTLNQLTVGEACSHINDFNAGTCTASDVLNNGCTVNDAAYHSDQITLMVNVYDTSCFGYHETSGSNTSTTNHNDKMALVSAATIDAWAAANGNPGEAVTDSWNRSFMGFDYELLSKSEITLDSYAELGQVQNLNNIRYAWDGSKVMTIGPAPESTATTKNDDFDLFPYFALHATGSTNNNGSTATCTVADGKISCYFPQYTAITFGQGNQDWAPYSKLVIEFEASPINGTVMNTAFSVGDTKVEVNLNNEHWWGDDQGPVISTYDGSTGTLNITSVKLIGKTIQGVTVDPSMYYNPTYLLGDAANQKISFYSPNTNMYGGIVRTVTANDITTTIDGKTCLNLTFFQRLVANGYHPITTDLQTWVKWQAACDGYYSDWIVTLTEAKRQPDTQTHEDPIDPQPNVWCYAFEDTENGDYDMNDVVLKVKENGDNIDVWLVAAGATLDLTIKLYAYDATNAAGNYYGSSYRTLEYNGQSEIHLMWGVDPGTMVNTNAGASATPIRIAQLPKSDGYEADKLRFSINSNVWEVKLSGSGQAPYGVMIPMDWRWPTERTRITKAYNNKNTQETEADQSFTNFMGNAGHAELWYKYPTTSTMIVDIPE